MLTTLWLVLLILRAGTATPDTNSQTSVTPAAREPVIIIVD